MGAQSDWIERVSDSAQTIVSVLLINRMMECTVSLEYLKLLLMMQKMLLYVKGLKAVEGLEAVSQF
jgi:hypothetical protein